ncbi:Aminomethyltransferase (glycine cleavage system T protein) [hydrothermal vent metagenome]|uniref:aminomethyltransferase n=1 Tax=hydrothermal vent metagenome TaxID=652676 RepID=A0A3B1AV49_9ZZZZ
MPQKTPLYETHVELKAKIVDFGGWDMPLHYGSQIDEHHIIRKDAGMFDVSHMTVLDLKGDKVRDFLKYLLANNVDRLQKEGKALYSCMLNEQGGIIDDLIVYFMQENWFRLVVNAATRDKDIAWITQQASKFSVEVIERSDLAMVAIQGPTARDKVHSIVSEFVSVLKDMGQFFAVLVNDMFIARTGYTGEDGYEIILPKDQVVAFWKKLVAAGVRPCGLGARDTLRLEAGMSLYGTDMTEDTSPLISGLNWTVAWEPAERDFIGRKALEAEKENGITQKQIGLVLTSKGMLRNHLKVFNQGLECGEITSGSFSPTLGKAIALARVSKEVVEQCSINIRGKLVDARVVKAPFVRHGKTCIEL